MDKKHAIICTKAIFSKVLSTAESTMLLFVAVRMMCKTQKTLKLLKDVYCLKHNTDKNIIVKCDVIL